MPPETYATCAPGQRSPVLLSDENPYHVHHGDCIPHMHAMPPASVDLAVFSPPFPAVYSYTDKAADLGNSEELQSEAKLHFSFFFKALRRVLKPGRVAVVHCTEIVRMKRSGGEGMFPFPDLLRRLGMRAGFVYEYTWQVAKNPQAQAIRTKSRNLQFAGLESDRAQSRGAMADYLIKFVAPGDNAAPVDSKGEVSRNDWIDWAECCWYGIREAETLNVREGRAEDDTRHICPLQLPVIRRVVRLYSNPGEVVFSPFAGIASELYEALRLGRRGYGIELKDEYHAAAILNCERAIAQKRESQTMLLPGFTAA